MARDWKHIIKRVVLILVVPVIVFAFIATNYLSKNNVCKDVKINVENENIVKFVTQAEMKNVLVNAKNIIPGSTLLKNINIQQLETIALNNPWVKEANIYIDHRDVVNVNIKQKEPVLRWMNGDLIQSYLDESGSAIPVSDVYSANVPIVTSNKLNVSLKEQKLKLQMVALCKYIQQDTFWNASIAQININQKLKFELVTVLGNHIIEFGDTTNMQNKFARLFQFYKEAMPRTGWNTYKRLSVQFDGQIVAEKTDSMKVADAKNAILAKTGKATVTPKAPIKTPIKTSPKPSIVPIKKHAKLNTNKTVAPPKPVENKPNKTPTKISKPKPQPKKITPTKNSQQKY